MAKIAKQQRKDQFRSDLDAEVVVVPGGALQSALRFFTHLEQTATFDGKCLECFLEVADKEDGEFSESNLAADFGARTVTFRQFGRQLIRTGLAQVRTLQARVDRLQSLVLINNWDTAEELWSSALTQCKTPLFELNLLQELWEMDPEFCGLSNCSILRHSRELIILQAEMGLVFARRADLIELSIIIERRLGSWLRQFERIFKHLDELSRG